MAECTKDNGLTDFSMEKASILTDLEERFQENGLKDREDENIYITTFDLSKDQKISNQQSIIFYSFSIKNIIIFDLLKYSPLGSQQVIILQKTKIQEQEQLYLS
ncbi:unnamed protein product (macronuclear) [Paramecium tetraurelia]|uniref:Uncharacterized protein n=1 Tax=Paramecium tetraurelia TaxID=5888 RepID=A0BGJ1_PARTE|nr:uncharacterized protein GSPATT00028693001 [Paramecium tetraurelia]CAK57658.1 unnamed protein product [Paramecium tetraurelia]|eukprot:XP_001425056.1 hypothetical protein (macronuclear) [Paramecium tetraurelia strain d4-2]